MVESPEEIEKKSADETPSAEDAIVDDAQLDTDATEGTEQEDTAKGKSNGNGRNKERQKKRALRKTKNERRREDLKVREEAVAIAERTISEHENRTATRAKAKKRHWMALFTFLLFVCAPVGAAGWYLWERAVDQYASNIIFTVRQEEVGSASNLLTGLTGLGSSGSTDTDILNEFIQSQNLVSKINETVDLHTLYSETYKKDPVFSLKPDGTVEDLVNYWRRIVKISYDPGSGMIELRLLAFDPNDAQRIAQEVLAESSEMINELSAAAREDATRYARSDLDDAVSRLKEAREAITEWRLRTKIVDPNADLQGRIGLLNTLQQQLAEALIELDLIRETTRENDPRIAQGERRIEVIRLRISEERGRVAESPLGEQGDDYATLLTEFERLTVDREFAELTYTAALTAFDNARAEAQRQSRYLTAFVKPTLAERAEYPQRYILLAVVSLILLMTWTTLILVYYALRDRR